MIPKNLENKRKIKNKNKNEYYLKNKMFMPIGNVRIDGKYLQKNNWYSKNNWPINIYGEFSTIYKIFFPLILF